MKNTVTIIIFTAFFLATLLVPAHIQAKPNEQLNTLPNNSTFSICLDLPKNCKKN
jgi:hypothetical protein